MLWRGCHDVTEYAHPVMHERDDPDAVLIKIVIVPRLAFERFYPFERQESADFVSWIRRFWKSEDFRTYLGR